LLKVTPKLDVMPDRALTQMAEIGQALPTQRQQVVVAFVCNTDAYLAQQREISRPSFSGATLHLLGKRFEPVWCFLSTSSGDQHDISSTDDDMEHIRSKPPGCLVRPDL